MPSDGRHIKVFISYSHDSNNHRRRVLALSDKLRNDSLDCSIDRYEENNPPSSWPLWCLRKIQDADFVLVVSTATYKRRFEGREKKGKGKGAKWEGFIITQELYEAEGESKKFIPVVLRKDDTGAIPALLRGTTYHNVSEDADYRALLRRLLGVPLAVPPPLGKAPDLATLGLTERTLSSVQASAGTELQASRRESASRVTPCLTGAPSIEQTEMVRGILAAQGVTGAVACGLQPPITDLPTLVGHSSSRRGPVNTITARFEKCSWVAIAGPCGSGKTQLAVLVAGSVSTPTHWVRLRDTKSAEDAGARLDFALQSITGCRLEPKRQAFYAAVSEGLGGGSLLVIDDVPRFAGGDALCDRLVTLAAACHAGGARILTTSNLGLPQAVLQTLGHDIVQELPAPPFSADETREVLAAYEYFRRKYNIG